MQAHSVAPQADCSAFTVLRTVQSYAAPLLDILDPHKRLFAHRVYRDACLRVPSQHEPGVAYLMKDLSSLGRDLSRTFIVDNTPTVCLPCLTCLGEGVRGMC